MRAWPFFLLASLLPGQAAKPLAGPAASTPPQFQRLKATLMTPQALLRAMVALDQAQRKQAGAIVEVIGYDDEARLHLLFLKVTERVRLEYSAMDKAGHRELYAFMHQDPSRPSGVPAVPILAGGKVSRPEDKWLR